jgi:hypothetical protein
VAQSGHFTAEFRCPLLGVKQTSQIRTVMSAFDPKRTCEGRRRLVSQSNYFGPKMELTKMMPIALKSARSPVMVSCTPVEYDPADDRERSMVGDDSHPTAAFIAAKLRAAGFECEMVSLVPTEAAVLWRDRIVIVFAVAFLTALAFLGSRTYALLNARRRLHS